jgi:pyruvate/2-oxoglutarate dehydrogenase complex dihydrolipoamide dehydrogenase (E3) component
MLRLRTSLTGKPQRSASPSPARSHWTTAKPSRSRKAAEGRVRGVHFLMKKNGIAEIHGRGSFAGPNTLQVVGVARNIHVHPTLGEAVKDAVQGLAGDMINM